MNEFHIYRTKYWDWKIDWFSGFCWGFHPCGLVWLSYIASELQPKLRDALSDFPTYQFICHLKMLSEKCCPQDLNSSVSKRLHGSSPRCVELGESVCPLWLMPKLSLHRSCAAPVDPINILFYIFNCGCAACWFQMTSQTVLAEGRAVVALNALMYFSL